MFDDIISGLSRAEEAFNGQVKDVFGRSIDKEVFQPVIDELQRLELTRSEAEVREKEIHAITLELRMIL